MKLLLMRVIVRFFSSRVWVFLSALIISVASQANPVLDNVAHGDVNVQQTSTTTTINQTSNQAIINWHSFNINTNEATHFNQPTNGIAFNRIDANQGASQIYGQLSATGRIVLLNPAGIYFGSTARVNVGGLIASTGSMNDADILAGKYIISNSDHGVISNAGTIIAEKNGLVALLGGTVNNSGYIEASLGKIVLASGETYAVSLSGNDLVSFDVGNNLDNQNTQNDGLPRGVSNSGMLVAEGGKVILSAKSASGILDRTINMHGVIEAKSVGVRNGEIILNGGAGGSVYVSGKIIASGKRAGERGGHVAITGKKIKIERSAVIDVAGDIGGGVVEIGGNYQGLGTLQHASSVQMESGAVIDASAITNGNGGQVVLWSDDDTSVAGTILAKGGLFGGNGGLIETSSKNYLYVHDISVSTLAPNGMTGNWLLDPSNIYIALNQVNATTAGMTGVDSSASGGSGTPFQASGIVQDSLLTTAALGTALGLTNVTVTTANVSGTGVGNITVVDPVSWATANSLTLNAANNINLNANITGLAGGLVLQAGSAAATVNATGAINVANFNLIGGSWTQISPVLPAFNVSNNFQINSGVMPSANATFIRASGGTGVSGDPYLINDIYGLQGIGSTALTQAQYFNLVGPINASVTSTWNSGAGFKSISNYTGHFDGTGNTITGLVINPAINSSIGLFSIIGATGVVSNVTLSGGTIGNPIGAGGPYVGSLAGQNLGNINNVSVDNVNVYGFNSVGGLVGLNSGTIDGAGATIKATVSAVQVGATVAGGVVGTNTSTGVIKNLTASSSSTTLNGVGGLVGSNAGTIDGATIVFAGSNVIGNSAGGVVGVNQLGGVIKNIINPGFGITGAYLVDDLVGGIAGQNFGAINDIMLSGITIQGRDLVGGITGVNQATGTIGGTIVIGSLLSPVTVSARSSVGLLMGLNAATSTIDGSVTNITLSTTDVISGNSTGALVGQNDGTIQNINIALPDINIVDWTYVGGLVGINTGTILNVTTHNNVSSTYNGSNNNNQIGGLVGLNSGTIQNSQSTGAVIGGFNTGGLVGENTGSISGSTASGNVSVGGTDGRQNTGGLVGFNLGGTITNSAASGSVTGYANIGGLIGENADNGAVLSTLNGTITSSGTVFVATNSTGLPSGSAGGLIGYLASTIDGTNNITTTSVINSTTSNTSIIGGLVGQNAGGTIKNFPALALPSINITGANVSRVGGLVGYNNGGTIDTVFVSNNLINIPTGVNVTNGTNIGGLVGENNGSIINASVSSNVLGSSLVGGLVGFNTITGAITGTITSSGNVTGATGVGGLIGLNNGALSGTLTVAPGVIVTGTRSVGGFIGTNNANINGLGNNFSSNATVKAVAGSITRGFGFIGFNTADISNITIATGIMNDSTLSVAERVGGLVGDHEGGDITNATNQVDVLGGQNTGGLIGWGGAGSITNSHNTGNVTTTNSNAGGLVGGNFIPISNSDSTIGAVTGVGASSIGGLVGVNNGTITNSFATNNVSGVSNIGGLVGRSTGSIISSSSSIGSVTGTSIVGGLVGQNQGGATIANSSVTNDVVTGNSNVGGLIGWNNGSVSNSGNSGSVFGNINVGGLIGLNDTVGVITTLTNTGSVTGTQNVGGFIGSLLVGTNAGDNFVINGNVITEIIAGSGMNTITGDNVFTTWTVTGANVGSVLGNIGAYSNVQNLVGGTGGNTFNINNGGSQNSISAGVGGVNTLDYSAYSSPVSINLQNNTAPGIATTFSNINNFIGGIANDALIGANIANSWHITSNNAGNINNAMTFSSFENLTGGNLNDNFILNAGATLSGLLDGGAGNNTITGANTLNTWAITANNAGYIDSNNITFSNIQNITGGTANDNFVFNDGVSMAGIIDGGAGGVNTADFSSYTTPTNIVLNTADVYGYGGSASGISGLSHMNVIYGGSALNQFTGINNNSTWIINGLNQGIYNANGIASSLQFYGFANMIGGSGNDRFNFTSLALVNGFASGSVGDDTFDYSQFGSPISVVMTDLKSGSGTAYNDALPVSNRANPTNPVSRFTFVETVIGNDLGHFYVPAGAENQIVFLSGRLVGSELLAQGYVVDPINFQRFLFPVSSSIGGQFVGPLVNIASGNIYQENNTTLYNILPVYDLIDITNLIMVMPFKSYGCI